MPMVDAKRNKVIGIVSYLPDDESIRRVRQSRLTSLIDRLRCLFEGVPIWVIAQNWRDVDIRGIVKFEYDAPLGILGARRELRRVFLESNYEYLIMVDDDVAIIGDASDYYIRSIDDNPGRFYEKNASSLKLFCIHRDIFDDFPEVDPQKGEGYEDRAFVAQLRIKYPDKRYVFDGNMNLWVEDNATNDCFTTWERKCDSHEMLGRTNALIENMKDEYAKFNELRNVDSFSHVVEHRE